MYTTCWIPYNLTPAQNDAHMTQWHETRKICKPVAPKDAYDIVTDKNKFEISFVLWSTFMFVTVWIYGL